MQHPEGEVICVEDTQNEAELAFQVCRLLDGSEEYSQVSEYHVVPVQGEDGTIVGVQVTGITRDDEGGTGQLPTRMFEVRRLDEPPEDPPSPPPSNAPRSPLPEPQVPDLPTVLDPPAAVPETPKPAPPTTPQPAASQEGKVDPLAPRQKTLYRCGQCRFSSFILSALRRHMRRHSNKHQCEICSKTFACSRELQLHINGHMGIRPYKCKECDMSYRTGNDLLRHTRSVHTLEKPFRCCYCDYTSVEASRMKVHIRSHTGERPFVCPQCPFAATDAFKLRRHLRTHTGEKPYFCQLCQVRFTQNASLKTHILRKHTENVQKETCPICNTVLFGKNDVKNHIRKQHTFLETPIRCRICSEDFHERFLFRQHQDTHRTTKTSETIPGAPGSDVLQEKVEALNGREVVSLSGQEVVSLSGQEVVSLSGQEVVSLSGQEVVSLSGQEVVSLSGQEVVSLSGQEVVSLSGQEVVSLSGQEVVSLSGQEVVSLSGQEVVSLNGQEVVTLSGQEVVSLSGQEVEPLSGQEVEPLSGQVVEVLTGQEVVAVNGQTVEEINGQQVKLVTPEAVASWNMAPPEVEEPMCVTLEAAKQLSAVTELHGIPVQTEDGSIVQAIMVQDAQSLEAPSVQAEGYTIQHLQEVLQPLVEQQSAVIALDSVANHTMENAAQPDLTMETFPLATSTPQGPALKGRRIQPISPENQIEVKLHRCRECEETFATGMELVKHRKSHRQENVFKCPFCEHETTGALELILHIQVHNDDRPFHCEQCSFTTTDTFKLSRHMRTHTGEKPFSCHVCQARFTQKTSMEMHIQRKHTKELPKLSCPVCSTTLTGKHSLNIHMRKQHSHLEEELQCRFCPEKFRDRFTLREHQKTHRNDKAVKSTTTILPKKSQITEQPQGDQGNVVEPEPVAAAQAEEYTFQVLPTEQEIHFVIGEEEEMGTVTEYHLLPVQADDGRIISIQVAGLEQVGHIGTSAIHQVILGDF